MPQVDHEGEVADLRPGTHMLCLYDTEEEHRSWVTPFLREGLERGERVIYLRDRRSAETILDYLREVGVDPDPYVDSEQFTLPAARQTLFSDGRFDPQTALQNLSREIERAIEYGFTGLRMTSEMSWATHRRPGSGRLMEFECKSNGIFAEELFIGMCQYDRRRFTPAQLLEAMAVHPEILSEQGRHRNIFFSTPRHVGEDCAATALLEHRLETIATRSRALRRLEEELEATTAVLDAVEAMVAVVDRQGCVVFLNRAWEEAWGQDAARPRRRPLWERGTTEDEKAALHALMAPDSPVAFPRRYQGRIALDGAPGREVICTARLLSATAGRERVVVTAREG